MSVYPGDSYNFILSLTHMDGTTPSVGTIPTIQIVNATTRASVLGTPATMTLVAGSVLVYTYTWVTSSAQAYGDYFAVVSYVADTVVVTGRYLDRVRLGDTYVTGQVALNSTVAKDITVAKDSTVAHLTDLATINPNNSSVVLSIQAKTNNLPVDPVSTSLITVLQGLITDIHDCNLGAIVIDRTQNPRVMTIRRVADGSTLATFQLSETSTTTTKIPS
jgi:hypothetical protein